jgi:hypothetical protein
VLPSQCPPWERRTGPVRKPVTTLCLAPTGTRGIGCPLPTLLTPPTLERVLKGLHDSEIRCGVQNEPPAGGITAWIDFGSRTEKAAPGALPAATRRAACHPPELRRHRGMRRAGVPLCHNCSPPLTIEVDFHQCPWTRFLNYPLSERFFASAARLRNSAMCPRRRSVHNAGHSIVSLAHPSPLWPAPRVKE